MATSGGWRDPHRVHGRGRHQKVVCATSGKVRYRDGDDAGLALRRLKGKRAKAELDGGVHSIEVVRKYSCESCGGWHLTSQPPRSAGRLTSSLGRRTVGAGLASPSDPAATARPAPAWMA